MCSVINTPKICIQLCSNVPICAVIKLECAVIKSKLGSIKNLSYKNE